MRPPDIRSPSSGRRVARLSWNGHRARAPHPRVRPSLSRRGFDSALIAPPSDPAAVCRTDGAELQPEPAASFRPAGPTPRKARSGRVLGVRRAARRHAHGVMRGLRAGERTRASCARAGSKCSANKSAARVEGWLRDRARATPPAQTAVSKLNLRGARRRVQGCSAPARPAGHHAPGLGEFGLRAFVAAKIEQRARMLALLGFSNALTAEPDVVCRALLGPPKDQQR